jgi:hypothetical protein
MSDQVSDVSTPTSLCQCLSLRSPLRRYPHRAFSWVLSKEYLLTGFSRSWLAHSAIACIFVDRICIWSQFDAYDSRTPIVRHVEDVVAPLVVCLSLRTPNSWFLAHLSRRFVALRPYRVLHSPLPFE